MPHIEHNIAPPEDKAHLKEEVASCSTLGETLDQKRILLYRYDKPVSKNIHDGTQNFIETSAIMKEVGRLREESFRLVGEGTGLSRDLDEYDPHYDHIILWDEQDLEIVGAYRLRGCDTLPYSINAHEYLNIEAPLYTASLFDYRQSACSIFNEGLELGRSFVQAKYWGSRSLEYLWYGIAAYLRQHPQYKYLFGAVSISSSLSATAQSLLIQYYQTFYGPNNTFKDSVIRCKHPYQIEPTSLIQFDQLFEGQTRKDSFLTLKKQMRYLGFAVPVLYKQYADLTEQGGTQFLGFNIDPDFSDCIDGFVVVDIDQMTAAKRKRYQLSNHRV